MGIISKIYNKRFKTKICIIALLIISVYVLGGCSNFNPVVEPDTKSYSSVDYSSLFTSNLGSDNFNIWVSCSYPSKWTVRDNYLLSPRENQSDIFYDNISIAVRKLTPEELISAVNNFGNSNNESVLQDGFDANQNMELVDLGFGTLFNCLSEDYVVKFFYQNHEFKSRFVGTIINEYAVMFTLISLEDDFQHYNTIFQNIVDSARLTLEETIQVEVGAICKLSTSNHFIVAPEGMQHEWIIASKSAGIEANLEQISEAQVEIKPDYIGVLNINENIKSNGKDVLNYKVRIESTPKKVWEKECRALGMESDSLGNVYISLADKVTKLDSNGAVVWEKTYSGIISNLCIKGQYLYVVGESTYFDMVTSVDNYLAENGISNNDITYGLYLSKMSLDGNVEWTHMTGSVLRMPGGFISSGQLSCYALLVDNDSVYLSCGSPGDFNGVQPEGKTLTDWNDQDTYLIKYTIEGDRVWTTYLGCQESDIGVDMVYKSNGNILLIHNVMNVGSTIYEVDTNGEHSVYCQLSDNNHYLYMNIDSDDNVYIRATGSYDGLLKIDTSGELTELSNIRTSTIVIDDYDQFITYPGVSLKAFDNDGQLLIAKDVRAGDSGSTKINKAGNYLYLHDNRSSETLYMYKLFSD